MVPGIEVALSDGARALLALIDPETFSDVIHQLEGAAERESINDVTAALLFALADAVREERAETSTATS